MTKASDDPRWQVLTHRERVALLEKYRTVHVDYEWWEYTVECFVEDMEQIGIRTEKEHVTFSGFWCQGDGSAFGGTVQDWPKMLRHLGLLLKYCHYWDGLEYMQFESTLSRNNMYFSVDFQPEWCPYDEDGEPLRYSAWCITHPTDIDLKNLEDSVKDVFEEAAHKLYKDLEAEYGYLTDDEQIIEYMLEHVGGIHEHRGNL